MASANDPTAPVCFDLTEGVGTITLNRPEAMNSLDLTTKEQLRDVVSAAAGDDAVRCVVLTGAGRGFCVGQDLKEHTALLQRQGSEELLSTVERHYNPVVETLATMPKPVIAAVNGVAAGAGASLALACDLRIMAASAGFNLAFAGVALSCDTGASWTLPRLVGRGKALELLYFPRTVPAGEARELGLATQVVDDAELADVVTQTAARLAAGPTTAFAAMRAAVNHSATHDLAGSLAYEAEMMQRTGATQDHQQAVSAFVAKETPVFTGH